VPLCFEVRINDNDPVVAGLDGIGVLTAPFRSKRDDEDFDEQQERQYYERLKKKYEPSS
jgi:hypothetical protein